MIPSRKKFIASANTQKSQVCPVPTKSKLFWSLIYRFGGISTNFINIGKSNFNKRINKNNSPKSNLKEAQEKRQEGTGLELILDYYTIKNNI